MFCGLFTVSILQVLSIVDSSYHILKDIKSQANLRGQEQRKQEQKQEKLVNYRERFSFNIPCIGVSMINSYPQVEYIVV